MRQTTAATTTGQKAENNDTKRRMKEADVASEEIRPGAHGEKILADLETLATKAKDLDTRNMSQAHREALATGMAKLTLKIESVLM